jgi:hypothetical protein
MINPATNLSTIVSSSLFFFHPKRNPTGGAVMSGWIPIYDTMHGLRGEVNIMVKVDFISNFNKYRKSSCGVQIFYGKTTFIHHLRIGVDHFSSERYNGFANLLRPPITYYWTSLLILDHSYRWELDKIQKLLKQKLKNF